MNGCAKANTSAYALSLTFHDNFRIVWLTDIHWGNKTSGADYSVERDHLDKIITSAKAKSTPDLLVLTGDVFQNATEEEVTSFFTLLDAYDLPWAFTYGNHDLTPFLAKPNFINEQIVKSKNSVFVDIENDNITGLANYYINLKEKDKTIYRLYLIDSNSYRVLSDEGSGYDIIHDDQLTHIKNIVDFEGQVPGLAFFHIPLKEYSSAYLGYIKGNYEGQGKNKEDPCPGYTNNGAYALFSSLGIKGCFCGHDHKNYSDINYENKMILSYGLKATDLDYYDPEELGYKEIFLPAKTENFSIQDIKSHFVSY